MNDYDLVQLLINKYNSGYESAWSQFFNKFKVPILTRVKQVFYQYQFRYGDNDLTEAFDFVIDHFLYSKALRGFKNNISLEAFIKKVATNATVDWMRKRMAEKKLYGTKDSDLSKAISDDDCIDENQITLETIISKYSLDQTDSLLLRLMLIGHHSINNDHFNNLKEISKLDIQNLQQKLYKLIDRLEGDETKAKQKFNKLQSLYLQLQVLNSKDSIHEHKIAKKSGQLNKLLTEYNKRGFSPFPSRQEISEIFNWDINKTDRLMRRLKEKLKPLTIK